MRLIRHKNFRKHYDRCDAYIQNKADVAIKKFCNNPFDPSIHNHPLSGEMSGKRAISVTGDIRIIFEEHDDYVLVIMLEIGTHNQVY